MPELPEVETARRGIEPYLRGHTVTAVKIRNRNLRWPVPRALIQTLPGQGIESVTRRGKYLLLRTAAGTALLHLGMSGSLRVLPADTRPANTIIWIWSWTVAGYCGCATRAVSARCCGPRRIPRVTNCCAPWVPNRWTKVLTAITYMQNHAGGRWPSKISS